MNKQTVAQFLIFVEANGWHYHRLREIDQINVAKDFIKLVEASGEMKSSPANLDRRTRILINSWREKARVEWERF